MLAHMVRIYWFKWTAYASLHGTYNYHPRHCGTGVVDTFSVIYPPPGDEPMNGPVHVKVKKWLEDVIESSEKAVDRGWKVEVDEDDETVMLVDSDQVPFRLTVVAGPDVTYIAFITGLNLKGAEAGALAPALREMLVKNKAVDL